MRKTRTLVLFISLSLVSCIKISQQAATSNAPLFVTSTLAPTKPGLSLPTDTPAPATSTSEATHPVAEISAALQSTSTSAVDCEDSAVLVQDVTVPDYTTVPGGGKFTKIWKFKNMGRCPWHGYTVVFLSGDRMSTADSAPIPATEARATVDVSIDLVAPQNDGTFTGIFELRDASGKVIPIGTERSFWVKIVVGNGGSLASGRPKDPAVPAKPVNLAQCQYSENAAYVQELIGLINQARAEAQVPTLTVSTPLTTAAQVHSVDMACGNFLSHYGSDGSYISDRVRAAGYAGYGSEIIAIGTPQDAMNQWRNDPGHWEFVLNPYVTEIGVGYAYCAASDFGGYFTVDF